MINKIIAFNQKHKKLSLFETAKKFHYQDWHNYTLARSSSNGLRVLATIDAPNLTGSTFSVNCFAPLVGIVADFFQAKQGIEQLSTAQVFKKRGMETQALKRDGIINIFRGITSFFANLFIIPAHLVLQLAGFVFGGISFGFNFIASGLGLSKSLGIDLPYNYAQIKKSTLRLQKIKSIKMDSILRRDIRTCLKIQRRYHWLDCFGNIFLSLARVCLMVSAMAGLVSICQGVWLGFTSPFTWVAVAGCLVYLVGASFRLISQRYFNRIRSKSINLSGDYTVKPPYREDLPLPIYVADKLRLAIIRNPDKLCVEQRIAKEIFGISNLSDNTNLALRLALGNGAKV